MSCCDWDHVRPCGPVPGAPSDEPICACGCSGYDQRCGGHAWWMDSPELSEAMRILQIKELLPIQRAVMEVALAPYYVDTKVSTFFLGGRGGGKTTTYNLTKEWLIQRDKRKRGVEAEFE